METAKFTEAIWPHVSVKQCALSRAESVRGTDIQIAAAINSPLDVNAWAGVDCISSAPSASVSGSDILPDDNVKAT
jgi:hypothetical protein